MYYRGNILKQDYREARKWLLKAAQNGHPSAQNMLGEIYRDGKGVAADTQESIKWFRQAAQQTKIASEAKAAQENLADIYAKEAAKWRKKAQQQ